jgi:hypothetical protein
VSRSISPPDAPSPSPDQKAFPIPSCLSTSLAAWRLIDLGTLTVRPLMGLRHFSWLPLPPSTYQHPCARMILTRSA